MNLGTDLTDVHKSDIYIYIDRCIYIYIYIYVYVYVYVYIYIDR